VLVLNRNSGRGKTSGIELSQLQGPREPGSAEDLGVAGWLDQMEGRH
jgi:hypothetical protein